MDKLLRLRQMRNTRRWHTWPVINEQNLADHCWGVAMLCLYLTDWKPEPKLLAAALLHDATEIVTGDMPANAKREYGNNRVLEKRVEKELGVEMHLQLTDREQAVLWEADKIEMMLYAVEEKRLGNKMMDAVFDQVADKFVERWPGISDPAKRLVVQLMEVMGYQSKVGSIQ